MEALKKAEAELLLKKTEYYKQVDEVNRLKNIELLPELKKQYEGKCFKERNSYGCGSDTPDWFIYYFVKKVTSERSCEALSLQIDGNGKVDLENDRHLPLSMCENEITKSAFLSAVGVFENHIAKILEPCR